MNLTPVKYLIALSMTFLTLLIYSCSSKVEAHFEISNSTNQKIKYLSIQPDENINNFITIEPNSKVSFKTDMTGIPKVDGSYRISFHSVDTPKGFNFGYYSNGYPAESITRIDIQPDTIIIKPEYKKNY